MCDPSCTRSCGGGQLKWIIKNICGEVFENSQPLSSIHVFNNPASSIWGSNLLTHPLTIQSLASPFLPTSLHFQLSQIIISLGLPTFFLPAHFLSNISSGTLVSFLL